MHSHFTAQAFHDAAAADSAIAVTFYPEAAEHSLIAGQLKSRGTRTEEIPAAILRDLPAPLADEGEVAALRAALADERSTVERTMDSVVDRMLKELSW